MKRDMDLVRKLLFTIESESWPKMGEITSVEGYGDNEANYHLFIMHDAGLIEGMDMSSSRGLNFCVRRMTWDGHEFLEAACDEDRWQAVKAEMEQAGGFVFSVAKALLVESMRQKVGLSGLDGAP